MNLLFRFHQIYNKKHSAETKERAYGIGTCEKGFIVTKQIERN